MGTPFDNAHKESLQFKGHNLDIFSESPLDWVSKRRNGGLWLLSIMSNFLPLTDNAATQWKRKCWKADTGGGAASGGGSQTLLTSFPFFLCQVFIKRHTDIKTPN